MAADTLTHTLRDAITLAQAVDYVPGRPHVATLWRWATRGVRGVVLETAIVGGRRMTTPAMIEAHLRRLNEGGPISDEIDDADVARRGMAASQALEALGI